MAKEPTEDVSTIDLDPYAPRSTRSSVAFGWTMFFGAVLLGGLLWLWLNLPSLEKGSTAHQFAKFFGIFHPIAIHAPIALLAVALLIEILGRTPFARSWRGQGGFLLWLGTIGAVVAVLLGYTLGVVDKWTSNAFGIHQWTGIGVAVTALLATLFRSVDRQGLSILFLTASVGFVSVAGFYGGELTHGTGHLTKYVPDPIKVALGWEVEDKDKAAKDDPPDADPVIYTSMIVPMLERSCVECHGADDQDGELRLDSYEELFKAGESEYHAIVAGDPDESEALIRVTLDPDDDEYMPTKGDPLTEKEIKILEWWIREAKASETARVSEVEKPEEIQQLLGTVQEPATDKDA